MPKFCTLAKLFYGITGWPLRHTFSPDYFNKKFTELGIDAAYLKLPVEEISSFPGLLGANPRLRGLNVTIPHKTAVLPYLDALSEEAKATGAVNCIDIRNGKLIGHNTDWYGFLHSLKPLLQPHHTHALILGTGGASKAIAYALEQQGIAYRFVSRNAAAQTLSYSGLDAAIMDQYLVIVNTTPLGMVPHEDVAPGLPYQHLSTKHLLFDIVYRSGGLTPFLQQGIAHGAMVKDGLEMLYLQAEKSWDIWSAE